MRILHVVVTVDKNQGGLGAAALGLAGGQQQQGARAAVWTLASPDTIRQAREEFGQGAVEVIGFPTWEAVYSPSMLAGARKALGASFDILHQHSLWLAPSHVTLRWRRAFRRITVVAPHGTLEPYALARSTWKKQIAAWLYERRNLRAASCLQATSKAEAANFRRLGLANPIAVIPNAIPAA
jgi:glycosyltransferase involved in cell wall biosynthesis